MTFPAATEYEIEDATKKWLRGATDLDGGRKLRRELKKVSPHVPTKISPSAAASRRDPSPTDES